MRKPICLQLLPVLILLLFACKKENARSNTTSLAGETVAVKISPDQSYTFNFTEAGCITIVRQADHFLSSDVQLNEGNTAPQYLYIPAKGFTGADEVVLKFSKSVLVCSEPLYNGNAYTKSAIESKYTTLKITVGQ